MKKDEVCLETLRLAEQIERIVRHFVERHQPQSAAPAPPPLWMTEKHLAEYWQMWTSGGEATVHSIRKWTARPDDEHPLPCASMGEMRRYHREEVDQWAREEVTWQKNKRSGMKLVQKRVS